MNNQVFGKKPGDRIIASIRSDAERKSYQAYIERLMFGDHVKDMGGIQRSMDVDNSLPPLASFMRPLDVATLRWWPDTTTMSCRFEDDRGLVFRIRWRDIERGRRIELLDGKFFEFAPITDKLRRTVSLLDDRSVVYPIHLDALRRPGELRAPIPMRGVLNGTWKLQTPINFTDPNNKKEAINVAQVKKTTDTETPIEHTQPKFGLFFKVNDLPQELTQKQTVEHVSKLLTLGAATINVTRYVRDETSERFAHRY